MFTDTDLTNRLVRTMDREAELLNHYCKLEKELFSSITARNWEGLEVTTQKLEKTAVIIREVDKAREEIVSDIQEQVGARDKERFYRFLQRLPEGIRAPLAASFRDMKIAVFRLQALNNQIQGYLRTKTGTLRDIMDELFPHQKGNLYCRQGKSAEPEANPMFVSEHM